MVLGRRAGSSIQSLVCLLPIATTAGSSFATVFLEESSLTLGPLMRLQCATALGLCAWLSFERRHRLPVKTHDLCHPKTDLQGYSNSLRLHICVVALHQPNFCTCQILVRRDVVLNLAAITYR